MKFVAKKLRGIARYFRQKRAVKQPGELDFGRVRILFLIINVIFVGLLTRAFIIQVFPPSKENLRKIAQRQYEDHLELAPIRGPIYDRQKNLLAVSLKKPSLACNPRIFKPSHDEFRKLAKILGISTTKLKTISQKNSHFSWIKRRMTQQAAEEVEELSLNGLYIVSEPARFYPSQATAAALVGGIGSDNLGLFGLERQFEKNLAGVSAKIRPAKDARGKSIYFESEEAAPEKAGDSITLTIDRTIQEIADQALAEGVARAEAKSGFALVLDPYSGKILAVSHAPSFDPNHLEKINISATRSSALLDTFEPGSIMKGITISGAVEQKKLSKDDMFNCENGVYRVGGVAFHDDHPEDKLSVVDTLIRSNNICTYKIAEKLGKSKLESTFKSFGFGGELIKDQFFPATTNGAVSSSENWKPIRFANVAFGQGLTVTGLEMLMAYGAIANGGNLMKPILIEKIESATGELKYSTTSEVLRTVVSPRTASTMREMMQQVVEDKHGTGSRAKTAHYSVAGKTGTGQKVDPITRRYSNHKRVASFVGFTPVKDPSLTILVVIDEPGNKPYTGGMWAAPVFSAIAEDSLRYLNVASDKAELSMQPAP